jgi:hypothetical protein
MDFGSKLSHLFGVHKNIEVVAPENMTGDIQNTEHYRSSTTNSYNKCIYEFIDIFSPEIIELAIQVIEKHDKNNFTEFVDLGSINNTDKQYISEKHILRIVGKYEFKWLSHCKSIEMWIDIIYMPIIKFKRP